MEFRILGPLEATHGEEPVPLGGRKQRALIARLLLDANRTVAVDRLVDDLWGEDVPDTAAKMVQIAVSRLRKVLPEGVLVTRPPGYALEVAPEALDLEQFNRLRVEARAALAANDSEAAARLGREALALWRGPALEEFPEPFAEAEGGHLEELRLTCLADRIEADLAQGNHADCVAELEALVGRHPLRERLRSQQMVALYRSGRQAEALEAFQRYRRKLDEELGLVPSAELLELNDRIIRQDPDLGGPPAEGAMPPAATAEGASAAEGPDEPAPAGTAPPAPAATERRHLTIVAGTLPEGTLAGLDPEEAHTRVVAFQRAAGEAVDELGGHPAQQLGATFLAYFGWPVAHEDGPLRAVRAALRVARETGARVGVDSGLAVVGGEGFGAVGGTATRAQSLAERAADTTVLVGTATEALVRGWVDARADGDGAFLVSGESGIRSSLELAHARGLTPFVGREPEFHLLHERWRRTAAGSGQVVFVSGEPGVGKSRIVDALARRIDAERPARLTFRCQADDGASALHPVRGALGPAMPHDDDPERLRSTIAELILRRAEGAPLLAVFEDLHWADASTLELLGLLIRRAPSASILVLATFRHDFRPRPDLLGHVTQLTLARLDRGETEEMIQALVGEEAASPELLERIAERTDGIPLFIEEAVRHLEEGGSLAEDVPATLQDSLMARLDRLGEAREVAQTAALIAREFPFELLQAIIPGDEQELRAAVDRLVDAGILYDAGRGDRYLFKHALLQEAAYDSLLQSTRQELHEKVAHVLEEHFEELVAVQPECVARHLTRAGRTVDALPHWLRAGERSLAASAYPEATAHLESGLSLLPELPDEQQRAVLELKFLQRLGTARMGAAGYGAPQNEATFARAEELSRTLDDSAQLAPALFGLTTYYMATAQEERGYPIALRLRRIGEAAGADPIVTGAEALLGGCAFLLGRLQDAREHLDGALRCWDPAVHRDLAVRFGREPGIIALNLRGLVLAWLGEIVPGRRNAGQAVAAARDVGHPIALCFALGASGVLEQALGDVERTGAIGREMIAVASEHRLPIWNAWGRTFDGWAQLRGGEVDHGFEQALRGLDMARAAGFRTTSPAMVAALADACVRAGIPDAAASVVAEVAPLVEPERERVFAPELQRVRAAALLAESPGSAEAEQALREAHSLARELRAPLPTLTTAHTLAGLLEARGEPAEAHTLLSDALAAFGDDRSAPVVAEAAVALDGLAQRAA